MSLFRRKKKVKTEEFIDPELDIELEYRKKRENSREDRSFSDIEDMQYVRLHCEQVAESSRYIEELKNENMVVQSYILDIQKIENIPEPARKNLRRISEQIGTLEKKRQDFHDRTQALPRNRMSVFERYEEDFPKALTNMQNDEKYCTAVKHDMRLLEAEKISLKEDMESYSNRHVFLKNVSVVLLFVLLIVFAVFFISGELNSQGGRTLFMIVLLLSALLTGFIFILQRNAAFQFKMSEKKLVRAVCLLNKTKIKYVNIVGSVDYQHEKYGVKNAYQLGREYEAYLSDRKNSERYHNSVKELDAMVLELYKALEPLQLYDSSIWEKQYSALSNDKEMEEIRKRLEVRRKKLKEQIDYNIERIDKARNSVVEFIKKHPDKSKEIMEIVDSYDAAGNEN